MYKYSLLRRFVVYSIVNLKQPVWFGCDSCQFGDREMGVWDPKLYAYKRTYDTNIGTINSDGESSYVNHYL